MGFAEIPDEIKAGRNQVVLELDRVELSQFIDVLKLALKELSAPGATNQVPEPSPPRPSPIHPSIAWLPPSSPQPRSEESFFSGPLPPSRALDSSFFSSGFPSSSGPTSLSFSNDPSLHPLSLNVASPSMVALQQRHLGSNASPDRETHFGLIQVPPEPNGTIGPAAGAATRPGEVTPVKAISLSPIAPPHAHSSVNLSAPQQDRPWSSASSSSYGVAIASAQIPRTEAVNFHHSEGISALSTAVQTKAVGLQVSGHLASVSRGPGNAPAPDQGLLFPSSHGLSDPRLGPSEAGSHGGYRAVKQGPVQGPSLALLGTEEPQHVTTASSKSLSRIQGQTEKISIGLMPPTSAGLIDVANSPFAPRGPPGVQASMQGPYSQMLKPGFGQPGALVNTGSDVHGHSQRMPRASGPRFSKGGMVRVPIESSLWKGRWTTAATEHNRESVTALAYCSAFDGLSQRETHTGWLVSSSKNLLNLWECAAQSKTSESPPLQLSHSQATGFVMESMDIDHASNVLISICFDTKDGGFSIPLHSLNGETFFSYMGIIRVPDNGGISPLRKHASTSGYLRLVSLSSAGGQLSNCIAAAVGLDVLVYDLAAVSSSGSPAPASPPPKAYWRAHDSPISAMHRSVLACVLTTGAADGRIRVWDMRTKPSAPVRQFSQQKQITGLSMLDQVTLSSCGADGAVHLWDLRQANSSVFSVNPDGKPIVNMTANPTKETIALTTRKGLYCWELSEIPGASSLLSPFTPLPPAGPCTDVKWNEESNLEVYVSSVDGTINVFNKM